MRSRRWSLSSSLAIVALVLTGCTSPDSAVVPEPSSSPTTSAEPAPTIRVQPPVIAVVLPRATSMHPPELARQRDSLQALADELMASGRASAVRVLVPVGTATLDEVVLAQADLGADLVCAIGQRAIRVVLEAAAEYPGTRFCAAPAGSSNVPENVLALAFRSEEQAFLAGVAAGLQPGATPGVVLRDAGLADRLRSAFEAGLRLVGPVEDDSVGLGLVADEAQARSDAEARYDTGIFTLWTRAGRFERGVLEAAEDRRRILIGSLEWLAADPEVGDVPWTLMLQGEDYAVPVAVAFEELTNGWTGGPRSLGFAQDAFVIEGGGSSLWSGIEAQIMQTRDAIADGAVAVPS